MIIKHLKNLKFRWVDRKILIKKIKRGKKIFKEINLIEYHLNQWNRLLQTENIVEISLRILG